MNNKRGSEATIFTMISLVLGIVLVVYMLFFSNSIIGKSFRAIGECGPSSVRVCMDTCNVPKKADGTWYSQYYMYTNNCDDNQVCCSVHQGIDSTTYGGSLKVYLGDGTYLSDGASLEPIVVENPTNDGLFEFPYLETEVTKGTYVYAKVYDELTHKTLMYIPPKYALNYDVLDYLINRYESKTNTESYTFMNNKISTLFTKSNTNSILISQENARKYYEQLDDVSSLSPLDKKISKDDLIKLIKGTSNPNTKPYRRLRITYMQVKSPIKQTDTGKSVDFSSANAIKTFYFTLKIPDPRVYFEMGNGLDVMTPVGGNNIYELTSTDDSKTVRLTSEYSDELNVSVSVYGQSLSKIKEDGCSFDEITVNGKTGMEAIDALNKSLFVDDKNDNWRTIEKEFDISVSDNLYSRIPIRITAIGSSDIDNDKNAKTKDIVQSSVLNLLLKGEKEDKILFTGLNPSLSKENTLRLKLTDDVSLKDDWTLYAVPNICNCKEGISETDGIKKIASSKLDEVAENPTEEQNQGFKFKTYGNGEYAGTFNDVSANGDYLCLKANIMKDGFSQPKYLLATESYSRNVPVKVNLDTEPPTLVLDYHPFYYRMEVSCADKGSDSDHISGCAEQPFSYSYVTDPLKFFTSIVVSPAQQGSLKPDWSGCPDLNDDSAWLQVTAKTNRALINNVVGSDEFKVICVRAKDAAGNAVSENSLVYSPDLVLGLALKKLHEELDDGKN